MSSSKNSKKNVTAIHTMGAPIVPASNVGVEVGLTDTIARNRACTPVAASAIPAAPQAYLPTNVDMRRRVLRVVSGDLSSEALHALEEIVAHEGTFQKDLGELAPDPAPAKKLLSRVKDIDSTLAVLDSLVQYHREIEDIALSDTMQILEAAYKEYSHRVDRMPQLATRYPALVRFFEARSAAISAGIGRAKADKVAKKPAESSSPA